MGADVYVVPELSSNEMIALPSEYLMFWVGDNVKKGLGVIYNKKNNCKIAKWYNPIHKYALPFWCDDILCLAMWPTKTNDNNGLQYPQIAVNIINEYLKHLRGYKVFICGDFNCYVGQSGENATKFSIAKIFELLNRYNIYSLYHSVSGDKLGFEKTPTYYFRFNKERPFFIDYAFANFAIKAFEIAKWEKSISDHCALITQF